MTGERKQWRAARLSSQAGFARDVLAALPNSVIEECLKAGTVPGIVTGTVTTEDMIDGFPTMSVTAAPALEHAASEAALRSNPDDPRRRSREHGFAEDTSVERTAQARACRVCKGLGRMRDGQREYRCGACRGSGLIDLSDPAGAAVDELAAALGEVWRLCKVIKQRREFLMDIRTVRVRREPSLQGNCECCGDWVTGLGNDRLRTGFDKKCHEAWRRWKEANPPAVGEMFDKARFIRERQEKLRQEKDGD